MILNSDTNHNAAGIVRHSCGIIFVLFSFFYLFFLEGEILSKAQYVFSYGKTTYSIFWGALIITVVLRALQLAVQYFVKLPIRYHALTYVPSILMLSIINKIASSASKDGSLSWWLGVPLCLFVFYFISKNIASFDSLFDSEQKRLGKKSPFIWPNYLLLMMLFLICGTCNPATDVEMYEQKVERLVVDGKYEDALKVGNKSLSSNIRLSNLRMFALSKLGVLPDELFNYPQYYGSDGLLCISDTSSRLYRFDVSDICNYLGVECDSGVRSQKDFFQLALLHQQLITDSLIGIEVAKSNNPDSLNNQIQIRQNKLKKNKNRIDDYILCSLLLDRNIDSFKEKLNELYTVNVRYDSVLSVENLPIAYREALVMIYPELGDTAMIKLYTQFLNLKESVKDSTESSNQLRKTKISKSKTFANTFWWYYYNPNITQNRMFR